MSRDNGEPDGLWPDENQLVPLSSSSAAVAPSPNGDRPPWLDEDRAVARPIRLSAGEFTTERMLRPAPNVPSGGWRRAVFTLSGGHIAMGPSPEELRQRELVARVKTPVAGCRKIAFISRKGGVGKTSTCLLVGHTFAIHRGDRVIAVDGNPDAGTLGHRVRRETTANLTSLLADAGRIERYADVRGYTSQAPSRLEVVASDDDPRITQAIGEQEFHRAIELLERHYNLVCLDTGTGVLESATRGILAAADQIVVVSAPSLDGARAASATLDWLDANGLRRARRRVGRGAQRGRKDTRARRRRPDRGALRQAVPCLRSHPVGSASRGGRRGNGGRPSARHPRRLPRTRRRDRLRLCQPDRKEAFAMIVVSTLVAATGIGGTPDPNGLPGSAALQSLISGIAFWALLASLGGLLISAAVWALSSHSGNYQHSALGRRGTVVSAVAAFIVGAAPAIVNFFENLGTDGALRCPAATSASIGLAAGDPRRGAFPSRSRGRSCWWGSGSRSEPASHRRGAPPRRRL